MNTALPLKIGVIHYGNTGCGVGGTKLERFLHKNQHIRKKLLSF